MTIQAVMKKMQSDCITRKGAYVAYSQCVEPTNTLIKMLPHTSNGICQALSAKWIAEHANDGSLWNWLFAPGSTNVKQAAIANLMINFTESVVKTGNLANRSLQGKSTGGDFYQDFVTDKYLGLYGVIRRQATQSAYMGSMKNPLSVGTQGHQLGSRFQQSWLCSKGGSYILISVLGKGGGHAMAAYVGQDIAFFDPNFGEFWFPSINEFYPWFLKFWQSSGYSNSFDKFYLLPYAKKV